MNKNYNILNKKSLRVSQSNLFMAKGKMFLLFFFSTVLLIACQSKLTESELIAYIKNSENGLIQQKQIGNVNYQITYKPTALMINQDLRGGKATEQLLDSLKRKYSNYYYFMLNVQVNNQEILNNKANDVGEFGQAVYQLSFNMNENTFLVNNQKDTLRLIDYVYPRMFGMSPQTSMLFVFEKGKKDEFLTLYLNEFGLNTGDTKYKFLVKDINKIPQLVHQ